LISTSTAALAFEPHRMSSPASRFTILVTIVEGRYFLRDPDHHLVVQCQFNDALFIENPETNSHSYPEVLSTDPVEQTPYPIWDTELAWDLDAEVLDILRVEHASLKLNCIAVNQKTDTEHVLGHIILDLNAAFERESSEEHWKALTGSSAVGFRGLLPELKIAFTIDRGMSGVTPTIDTLLTSIDHTSSDADMEALPRADKAKIEALEELDDELDIAAHYSVDDNDARVPRYRSTADQGEEDDFLDPADEVESEVPVDVGEALIPTEVNDNGYLQLGTGRDFFIFTVAIQSTRNIKRLVELYSANLDVPSSSVQDKLYLYYTFLGNSVATQLLTNLSNPSSSSTPIEEIALRLKSSMESMYQHFQDGEKLVVHLCHDSNIIGTATIPLAVILLHGTANLFHASPHTPAIRRSSQGTAPRRMTRPAAIEVDTLRKTNSSGSSRSPRRHDYKFSIEFSSFKSFNRDLSNVSLRYNYRPFGPKSTQPPINAPSNVTAHLPEAARTFQLCQTPEALHSQLKTPLAIQVWCQNPGSNQSVPYASGHIPLIDILDEDFELTSEGRVQRFQSHATVALEGSNVPAGEIRFVCSLEDLGEYFDSQQSEIFSTTPVHSMELHHHRNISEDLSSSGPEPMRGFFPRGNLDFVSTEQEEDERDKRRSQNFSQFAEGYVDTEQIKSTGPTRSSQRPSSTRQSQIRHYSQAHQNNHPHHHHPYGKPTAVPPKNDAPLDYQTTLKQQLSKQAELNRQVEYDLLRRSPISSLPHSLQQTLQADETTRGKICAFDDFGADETVSVQQLKQKMKDLKSLDYQVQKQLIALEFRERKLLRAEEALRRQQTNFQKVLERHEGSQDGLQHPNQSFNLQSNNLTLAGGSQPNAQDFFLLKDRLSALQRQQQLVEAEFTQYRRDHPAHIGVNNVNELHQTIVELESSNSKLMNDVTFANNYKEHYKALWTHSLQEIASMRQDMQMGMEIKMMQQFNEVDQLKLMNLTRSEAEHGQDRIILRGIKTELEILQNQMHPSYPDEDMSWEDSQEVPNQSPRQRQHRLDDREDLEESEQHGRQKLQYPFGQSQHRQFPRPYRQQYPKQHTSSQYNSKHQQQQRGPGVSSGYETFPSSSKLLHNPDVAAAGATTDCEFGELEDTLVLSC
ncbi:hypothetical protein BGW38_009365, partial [Lunasporangiospora selenospora]